ncbi:MAG: hypothetical protein RLZZ68_1339 [Bacteroidota bacterium]|jgi:hypothetical protein
MYLYSKSSNPYGEVPVQLVFKELEKDATWSYKMTYASPGQPGYVVKDYRIERFRDTLFMNEGEGIVLPMKLFGECLMDFYSIKDSDVSETYMGSQLCRTAKGTLEFKVFGGSLRPLSSKEIVDVQDGTFGLSTYNLGFFQSVVLKKVKK